MVIDVHEDDGGYVVFRPGMVAPGLAEAVAGDLAGDADGVYSGAEDAPGLNAGDGLLIPATVGEDILAPVSRIVEPEGMDSLRVQGNGLLLASLALGYVNVLIELTPTLVVDIAPAEAQEVADPQGGAGTEDDQNVVAVFPANQKVIGESLQVGFVSDGFGCCHSICRPFAINSSCERTEQRTNVTFYLAGYHYTIRLNHNST